MGRTGWIVVAVGVTLAGLAAAWQGDNPIMQRKLTASQRVLEGIALADLDLVRRQADALVELSRQAQFREPLRTPRYQLLAEEFQRTAEALSQNARDKNVDAAALSYMKLTLSCVECHKHVREARK